MQKKKYTGLVIAGAVILLLVIFMVSTYNSLVKKEEKVKQQWSEVQSTYQRRLDLVPNLVNTVKGVSEFEQSTLEQIAAARGEALSGMSNDALTAENYTAQQRAQDNLATATNRLIVVIEKYPTLKGTAAYAGLQTQLEGTERRIKVARNDFNAAVADYNKQVRGFPGNLVAGLLGYKPKDGFEAVAGSDKSVEIKF
ncbi:MAG: LemA family protein [Chitinophagaceae bacterium]|jgi:LemA protein|nr:LemA family protein [Sphingobacteriales bacterium]OJV97374.1 MAG: LemA family protein [Sphingobacteriales bacterium 44-61]TXJ23412.1 MAG: LemA family protein [Chitinophagaceae bacterium]